MIPMLKIAIIVGSTRPGRTGEGVAKWAYEVAQKRADAEFALLDLASFQLPLLDELADALHQFGFRKGQVRVG